MPNSLDPDQARHFMSGLIWVQTMHKVSADYTMYRWQRVNTHRAHNGLLIQLYINNIPCLSTEDDITWEMLKFTNTCTITGLDK